MTSQRACSAAEAFLSEDPRVGRTRAAVMDAVVQLIASEGPAAVTRQRVAHLARVSRSTLYRYWPGPEDLLLEALAAIVTGFDFTGPGRLRDELIAELKRRQHDMNQPVARTAFTTIVSRASHDAAAAELRDRLLRTISNGITHSVARRVERGELLPELDPDMLIAKLLGALSWRTFIEGRDITDQLIEEIVGSALAGWEMP